MKNPYPEQHDTHERQRGGNTAVVGEKHDLPKANQIHEDRRWDRGAQKIEAPDGE